MRSIFICLLFLPLIQSTVRIFGVLHQNVRLDCAATDEVKHCVWTHGGDTLEYVLGTQNISETHWNLELDPNDCGLTLKNVDFHAEGKWQCNRVNRFGVTHDPFDYFVHVIKPPTVKLKFSEKREEEFQVGYKYRVSCDTNPDLRHFITAKEILVTNSRNGVRKLNHSTTTQSFYTPQENDETLTCSVTLGNDKANHSSYYYKEFAQLQKINFIYSPSYVNETHYANSTTKIIYQGRTIPIEAFIRINQNQTLSVRVHTLDPDHFYILVKSEWLEEIDFKKGQLERSTTILFEVKKRLADIDITLKILLPLFVCVVLILTITVLLIAKRNHWWCFAPKNPAKPKTNRLMSKVNSLSSSNEDSPKSDDFKSDSASLASASSEYGDVHFYESVFDSKSSPRRHPEEPEEEEKPYEDTNIYDTLDFHRPIQHLQGHYASSKTLKSLCSTEDYLCPSDSSLLKE